MVRQRRDLTGERFGMLVATERVIRDDGTADWIVRCDCGDISKAPQWQLLKGNHVDCGCLAGVSRAQLVAGMVVQRQVIERLESAA